MEKKVISLTFFTPECKSFSYGKQIRCRNEDKTFVHIFSLHWLAIFVISMLKQQKIKEKDSPRARIFKLQNLACQSVVRRE